MFPLIDIHTHRPEPGTTCIRNIRLQGTVLAWPETDLFSAGIHPWDAAEAQEGWLDTIPADHPRLLAIGETGLDLRDGYAPRDVQEKWLAKQTDLANRLRKPLVIHNVHATEALQTFLKRRAAVPVLLHGFTGSPETAGQWLRQLPGVRFSFGPAVLRSPKTQKALQWIAMAKPEALFLETDDAPDVDLREMYNFAAVQTGLDTDRLADLIRQNFNALFPNIPLR